MTNPFDPNLAGIWGDIGISPSDLGCVMLDLKFARPEAFEPLLREMEQDAYVAKDAERIPWVDGIEERLHVTVLYGLTIDPNNHGQAVETLLSHGGHLDSVQRHGLYINGPEAFESNIPGEDYSCIVLRIGGRELREMNQALRLLPHIDTWPDYKAHATLGYVNKRTAGYWIERINQVLNTSSTLPPVSKLELVDVNLGKEKPWL